MAGDYHIDDKDRTGDDSQSVGLEPQASGDDSYLADSQSSDLLVGEELVGEELVGEELARPSENTNDPLVGSTVLSEEPVDMVPSTEQSMDDLECSQSEGSQSDADERQQELSDLLVGEELVEEELARPSENTNDPLVGSTVLSEEPVDMVPSTEQSMDYLECLESEGSQSDADERQQELSDLLVGEELVGEEQARPSESTNDPLVGSTVLSEEPLDMVPSTEQSMDDLECSQSEGSQSDADERQQEFSDLLVGEELVEEELARPSENTNDPLVGSTVLSKEPVDMVPSTEQSMDYLECLESEDSQSNADERQHEEQETTQRAGTATEPPDEDGYQQDARHQQEELTAGEEMPKPDEEHTADDIESQSPEEAAKTTPDYHSGTRSSPSRLVLALGCFIIIMLIILVVGLSVDFNQEKDKNNNQGLKGGTPPVASISLVPSISPLSTSSPTLLQKTPAPTIPFMIPLTAAPTSFMDQIELVRAWVIAQDYSSEQDLQNPYSPQSRATIFMAEDAMEIPDDTSVDFGNDWLERYVASLFYYALAGNNWISDLNFVDHSLPTCSWFQLQTFSSGAVSALGLMCNDETGHMEEIRIVENNLSGPIPSELGLLTDLIALGFEQNPLIIGTIPDTLQNLTALQRFKCMYCSLTGVIPTWIGQAWPELFLLGLTENSITGSLPASLSDLSNLFLIALDDNFLTGSLDALQSLSSLERVYLEQNDFVGTIDGAFMAAAVGLKTLDLSNNNLVGSVPTHLMESVEILDLHDNQLTVFSDTVPENNNLEMLALHRNPFVGTLPSSIDNLQALTHLDLTSTTFNGTMPQFGLASQSLTYLFLADTTFDAGTIPDSYQALTDLVDLSLKASSRTGVIPSWLENLDRLVLLDLHLNSLIGTIPSNLGGMDSLEFLLLNRNQLTGTIPSELALATSLQIIFVEGNSLAGTMDFICDASSLLAAAADCGGSIFPEIACKCCNECCYDSIPDCNSGQFLGQYEPQWADGYKRQYYDFTGGEE